MLLSGTHMMGMVTFNRCTVEGQTISPSVTLPQWQESKITYQTKSNICGTPINRGTSGIFKVSRICLDLSVSDAFVWNIEFQTKPCMLQCSKPAPRARLFCFILDLIPSVKQCFFYFSSIFYAGCQCGFGSLSSRQGVLDF